MISPREPFFTVLVAPHIIYTHTLFHWSRFGWFTAETTQFGHMLIKSLNNLRFLKCNQFTSKNVMVSFSLKGPRGRRVTSVFLYRNGPLHVGLMLSIHQCDVTSHEMALRFPLNSPGISVALQEPNVVIFGHPMWDTSHVNCTERHRIVCEKSESCLQ